MIPSNTILLTSEWMIKFNGILWNSRHRGPCGPYKPYFVDKVQQLVIQNGSQVLGKSRGTWSVILRYRIPHKKNNFHWIYIINILTDYVCPSAGEINVMNNSKIDRYHTTWKHDKARSLWIILGAQDYCVMRNSEAGSLKVLTIPACITARASRTCRDACRDRGANNPQGICLFVFHVLCYKSCCLWRILTSFQFVVTELCACSNFDRMRLLPMARLFMTSHSALWRHSHIAPYYHIYRAGASTRFTSTSTSTSTCNMCEYEYEYLIIAWVRVRVRVLVDEYEYEYEYRPMIYILYKQQYCIFQCLKRESSDSYKPGTKL